MVILLHEVASCFFYVTCGGILVATAIKYAVYR